MNREENKFKFVAKSRQQSIKSKQNEKSQKKKKIKPLKNKQKYDEKIKKSKLKKEKMISFESGLDDIDLNK